MHFFSRFKKNSCRNKQKAHISSLLLQNLEKQFGLTDHLIVPPEARKQVILF